MTKLLIILGTISTVVPSATATMAMSSTKSNLKENYSIDSFKSIIKLINSKYNNSQNMNNKNVDEILDTFSPSYYYKYVNDKKGNVLKWDSHARNTEILQTYKYTYINESSVQQKRLTASQTETVTESHEFSISAYENVSVKGKISIPLSGVSTEVKFDFGSNKNWKDVLTKTIEKTIPAQETIVNPHTKLHLEYIITQEIWDYIGIAQFKIENLNEKSFRIPFLYFDQKGDFDYMVWNNYSFNEIFKLLKSWGYESQISNGKIGGYSIISVDNVNNPKSAFVNLPLIWSSVNPGFIVRNYEEEI